uniref:Ribosomal protein S14 n=1 Tax=Amicula sp. isolate GU52X-4 cfCalB7 TaxID=3003489 RepID=A0A9E8Z776_9STRA|nr:ribosomal protein S14 [Amicula sp. isolate GU52X-4 cfCalB7]
MKKLLEKNKKLRLKLNKIEYKHFILKSIFKNFNFFDLIRWNAFLKLKKLSKKSSKISISNRCLYSINKKRFNKYSPFSRHIFLKLIRSGSINGLQKSSW